jgi:hypothetical protein
MPEHSHTTDENEQRLEKFGDSGATVNEVFEKLLDSLDSVPAVSGIHYLSTLPE